MDRKLRILGVPANGGGCAYYRCINPLTVLAEEMPDKIELRLNENPLQMEPSSVGCPPNDQLVDMNWADIVVISNILKFGGPYTARVCGIAKELGKFVHFDTDDLLTELYEDHKLMGVYRDNKLDEITKFLYHASDLVTVTQVKFAHRIQPYVRRIIAVIKNAIDYKLPSWNAQKVVVPYTRIGWAAGIHHKVDVKEFASIPHLVNQKVGRENVKWNFYGHPPPEPGRPKDWQDEVWPEYKQSLLRGFKGQQNWQIYYALPPDAYGVYYSDMDVSIAPLQMNSFNDSKSDIKVAEAGRYKIPLVASNVGCYNETIQNGKTGYLIDPDAPRTEWTRILTKLCKDKKHRIEIGNNLHAITEQMFDLRKTVKYRYELYLMAMKDVGYTPK